MRLTSSGSTWHSLWARPRRAYSSVPAQVERGPVRKCGDAMYARAVLGRLRGVMCMRCTKLLHTLDTHSDGNIRCTMYGPRTNPHEKIFSPFFFFSMQRREREPSPANGRVARRGSRTPRPGRVSETASNCKVAPLSVRGGARARAQGAWQGPRVAQPRRLTRLAGRPDRCGLRGSHIIWLVAHTDLGPDG